jgi:hypothetical protein
MSWCCRPTTAVMCMDARTDKALRGDANLAQSIADILFDADWHTHYVGQMVKYPAQPLLGFTMADQQLILRHTLEHRNK